MSLYITGAIQSEAHIIGPSVMAFVSREKVAQATLGVEDFTHPGHSGHPFGPVGLVSDWMVVGIISGITREAPLGRRLR